MVKGPEQNWGHEECGLGVGERNLEPLMESWWGKLMVDGGYSIGTLNYWNSIVNSIVEQSAKYNLKVNKEPKVFIFLTWKLLCYSEPGIHSKQ